ncbi:glycosyltransferase [Colwellia sp. 12G3]|uniref:glycosyltransferase n=1 Tax=Colwellia sp. 12G3 TaxID=2058299 RepID=UPI0012FE9796|nr:glycosyltransferase [Colwellia sp. 12G3]
MTDISQLKILAVVPRMYYPLLKGGLEISAHNILSLLSNHCESIVVAGGKHTNNLFISKLERRVLGKYPSKGLVDNCQVLSDIWHPTDVNDLIPKYKPDVLICFYSGESDLARIINNNSLPTIYFVFGNKNVTYLKAKKNNNAYVCESNFIKRIIEKEIGQDATVIKPIIAPEDYLVERKGDNILVINPHPIKGGDIVLQIAKKMPWRNFLIVGGWQHTSLNDDVIYIEKQLLKLKNVKRLPHTDNMKKIMEQSRCLLMPCRVEEAYGRSAAEAIISGIPVVASDRGALPETVGAGGVIINIEEPIHKWVDALELLYCDNDYYEKLSKNAIRESITKNRQVTFIEGQLLELLQQTLAY